ncbi:FAD binding domain-containing protein [Kineobactrum salinum]|uniref:Xanthine dehydrogenase family protein subunit M n=1 Tax=Kineobactrum salinum TaxID=2708301 RepID=A0A6C0U4W2_9GAMM|nr:FAD binding domain-containing protein [Kineobactrum salinum]QIB67200.1 xanthine dehydrogenase family protein subunit M [Kineobactrum salinum]
MRPLSYTASATLDEAVAGLAAGDRLLAGGTDLLPLLKADVLRASRLVDIKRAPVPDDIRRVAGHIRIGALATIAAIADHPLLEGPCSLLRQAARETATAQIRNRATLGGNLLQRPRCWYYRNSRSHCWLKGGADCPAIEGHHEHHAIFDDSPCRAIHPSDLAGCLLALNAEVVLFGLAGERSIPLREFYQPPEDERRKETVLAPDEIITGIDIPELPDNWRSIYLKAMERKTWAFALVGIAIVLQRSGDTIDEVRIAATGLAQIPRRLVYCEQALAGTAGTGDQIGAARDALGHGAHPLPDNGYKLDLARGLLERGLRTLLS